MRVAVVGTGYVGLISGICLSAKGHHVTCVDKLEAKVESINSGRPPIHERGLPELMSQFVGRRFFATTDIGEALDDAEISIIAVGTPYVGNEMDSTYLRAAAEEIGSKLRDRSDYHVVVVKSTVVPGTTESIVLSALEEKSGKKCGVDFGLTMNPEFLREGNAIEDFMNPDRIVIGGFDQRSIDKLDELYAVFSETEVIRTTLRTAEMIKYTANSLLATLISFSNEIGNLCSAVGNIDAVEVMKGVHADRRVSPILDSGERISPGIVTYLEAGCGFGGSCFPKDVKALIAHGEKLGESMRILRSVMDVNSDQPKRMLQILSNHYSDWGELRVAVLGLAFKPETDDMRESPAIPVIQSLAENGATIKVFDPVASDEAKKKFVDIMIDYCDNIEDCIDGVHAIMVMTRWDEFLRLPELVAELDEPPLVIDGRRMLAANAFSKYDGIGL